MNQKKIKILKDLFYLEEYSQIHSFDYFTNRFLIHSPLYLPNLKKGLVYLDETIKKNQKIFIYSDRDVDGITSTVILYDYLKTKFPDKEISFRNSREGDYYGITPKILEEIQSIDPDLIIFLDMGSSNTHYLKGLIENNKKIIILDHHIPQLENSKPEELEKFALINPLLSSILLEHNNKIPTVGLVYKFILGFELFQQNILEKYQVIKEKEDYYVFQNGFFIEKTKEKKAIFSSYKEISIEEVAKYFPEYSYDFLWNLLQKSPIEFGKLITCLSIELRKNILDLLLFYSTLVSIGYIADYVPLIGENRTIVKAGLGLLKYPFQLMEGLKALFQQLGLNIDALTSKDISWTLAPVLNSAGRIGETEKATDLLLEKKTMLALEKANQLIELNNQRKNKTKKNQEILQNNLNIIEEKDPFVFFYHQELESGVSGIMAARLAEKYQKPAIWINPDGEFAKGSIRSWNGINVLEMLLPLKHLFVDLGGHSEAAGFTIEYDKVEVLKNELKKITSHYHKGLDKSFLKKNINYLEFSIKPDLLGEDLLNDLRLLEPFGNGNKEIYFVLKSVRICNPEIFNEKHLKFQVVRALTDIEFILFNAIPDIIPNLEEIQKYRWTLCGIFERNIFYPVFTHCKYRFYIKTIEKKEEEKLDSLFKK